ncbi:MAG: mitochondrial ribosomal small subunit component [Thelocarpon superellum]|nr:MAG: mitochondrial ribosomal small subunit component [Thelocarpon superellum]
MGRISLNALRVRQTAQQLLETPRLTTPPPWFEVMGSIPPAPALVRTQIVQQHHAQPRRNKTKKASKMFKPQRIRYEEDALRREFFGDHPWELARPRLVLENDGKDGRRYDWSHIRQPGRALDGESVVQRQRWLLQNMPDMNPSKAYDQARQEFYAIRHHEDVERRVAKEEALAVGAFFGKSYLEVGMELEDEVYEEWKAWAKKETDAVERARGAAYTGLDNDPATIVPGATEMEPVVDEQAEAISEPEAALEGPGVNP